MQYLMGQGQPNHQNGDQKLGLRFMLEISDSRSWNKYTGDYVKIKSCDSYDADLKMCSIVICAVILWISV